MDARYRLAAVVSACILVLMAFAAPAGAHDSGISGPYACGVPKYSLCGYAQVRDNHEIVDACDTRRDGDGYFVRYRVSSGAVGTVGDANGSAAGCGIKRVGSPTIPIVTASISGFTASATTRSLTATIGLGRPTWLVASVR